MVVVGGADEPGRVPYLRGVDTRAVDAVALQPGAIVGEVLTHRADQNGLQAEVRHPEADVGADTASPHLQVVGQE